MDDRIQRTIKSLKALALNGDSRENLGAICSVLCKPNYGWTIGDCKRLRDALVGLLEQHDPADWSDSYLAEVGIVRLPKDERGESIHIGDELCGYGRPDGGVFCKGTNGVMVYVGEIGDDAPKQWLVWDPDNCRHYHKPTVQEIMVEYLRKFTSGEVSQDELPTVTDEYVTRIREAIAND